MLTLTAGDNSVVVAPEHGAAVIGWTRGMTAMMRHALPQAVMGNPHVMACFPLVPFCNRIGYARFAWRGREFSIDRNFGDNPHAIHGIGWQRCWTVEQVRPDGATLSLQHQGGSAWPFAFTAEIIYALDRFGLSATLAMTNRHDGPAPGGLGLHPYFPKHHDPALQFNALQVWENGSDMLPQLHVPVPEEWSHVEPLAVTQPRLDNCFTGWDRTAKVDAGPASLCLEADDAYPNLQVFTPHWADFFCVEPVSHVPDAINRPNLPADQAMATLQPGETLRGTIRMTCSPVQ